MRRLFRRFGRVALVFPYPKNIGFGKVIKLITGDLTRLKRLPQPLDYFHSS